MAGVIGVPGVPSAEELSSLPAGDLAVRLAEAYRLIAELTAQAGRMTAQVERWRVGGPGRGVLSLYIGNIPVTVHAVLAANFGRILSI